MLPFVLGLVYVLLCFPVAWLGRETPIGAVGVFIASLLLSPVVVFIAMIALARPRLRE